MALSHLYVTTDDVHEFLRNYYKDEIMRKLRDSESTIVIDYADLWKWNAELAECVYQEPDEVAELLEDSVASFDIPVDVPSDLDVKIVLPPEERKSVIDIEADNDAKYVAVEGRMNKCSERYTRLKTLLFRCSSCDRTLELDQGLFSVNKPRTQCECEYGHWDMVPEESEAANHVAFELKQPPGEASGNGESIVAHCDGDLVYRGGFLPNHTGKRVVVHGTVEVDASGLDQKNASPKIEEYLNVHWVEFKDGVAENANVDEHLDKIKEYASRDDAPQFYARSIMPEYWGQERMNDPLLGGVAFLFASYRVSPDGGRMYRGDIHGMYAGDPGTGKSSMASRIAQLSMRSESVSGNHVTGPGLTASASQDSFGGSEWTLTPGVLPRTDGGHVIIDELDKAKSSATESLHDALEGEQVVKTAKANQRATMSTKIGLLCTANPTDGRFNKTARWGKQLDIDDALFDRMDFIFAFKDRQDEERDRNIADSILRGMHESAELERKEMGKTDSVEQDVTKQPVDDEVLRAWVAYARDNCFPEFPTGKPAERLEEYYIDTRQRNSDSDGDSAIPTGPRTLQAGVRLSVAFARCRLSDKVEMQDVELAIQLTNRCMADMYFDPQTGEWNADMPKLGSTKTQNEKLQEIKDALSSTLVYPSQIAKKTRIDEDYCRDKLDTLAETSKDVEKVNGKFRSLSS